MPIPQVPSPLTQLLATKIYNAAWYGTAANPTAAIQTAITKAAADGVGNGVMVPDAFFTNGLYYDASAITFNTAVHMFAEKGSHQGNIYDVLAYGGRNPTTGDITNAARAAIRACSANGGGTIDFQNFPSSLYLMLGANIFADLAVYEKTPMTLLWGPHEVRVKVSQKLRSHKHFILRNTTFIAKDENGNRVLGFTLFDYPFDTLGFGGPGNGVATTSGSGVVTRSAPTTINWNGLEIGQPIHFFAFVPRLGRDNTTLNGGIGTSDTTITVGSTTGFITSGSSVTKIRIENELIMYTSLDATHFFGCTRGANGTTAASHSNGVAVDRAVYDSYVVDRISGNNITLAEGKTLNITSTTMDTVLGPLDIKFDGVGTFDGNKDPDNDDVNNLEVIHIEGGRDIYVGPGITFKNVDHAAITYRACMDSRYYGHYIQCGRLGGLGAATWMFNNCKNLLGDITIEECSAGIIMDERTTAPTTLDNATEGCVGYVRSMRRSNKGIHMEGTLRCEGFVGLNVDPQSGGNGVMIMSSQQWVTNGVPQDNYMETGMILGPGATTDISIGPGLEQGNNIYKMRRRGGVVNVATVSNSGSILQTPDYAVSLTYGTTIATDSSRSETFIINVSDGVAFTISNPTAAGFAGRKLTYYINNSSGGAMGAITFGSEFRLSGAFTNPANGQTRIINFQRVSGFWRETSRTAADQAIA